MKTLALSFDIEDWFCVQNMKDIFPFKEWKKCEIRVQESTKYILKALREHNIKATFFILGWIAERIPELVRDIMKDGHEMASHGYSHTMITQMTTSEFQKDIEKSLFILTNIIGHPINGYRAPSFSITRETIWALDILRNNGFKYDSSIYPVRHPDYGISGFRQNIHEINGMLEVPMTALSFCGFKIPISGGGYFRLSPYWLFRTLLQDRSAPDDIVTYFHPWEFDYEQPRINLPLLKKFRHYVGLKQNRDKFERLLNDFHFVPIEQIIKNHNLLTHATVQLNSLDQRAAY